MYTGKIPQAFSILSPQVTQELGSIGHWSLVQRLSTYSEGQLAKELAVQTLLLWPQQCHIGFYLWSETCNHSVENLEQAQISWSPLLLSCMEPQHPVISLLLVTSFSLVTITVVVVWASYILSAMIWNSSVLLFSSLKKFHKVVGVLLIPIILLLTPCPLFLLASHFRLSFLCTSSTMSMRSNLMPTAFTFGRISPLA